MSGHHTFLTLSEHLPAPCAGLDPFHVPTAILLWQRTAWTEDLAEYRIEVHGLKSAAANLGAMKLSEKAKAHEQAAIDGDVE